MSAALQTIAPQPADIDGRIDAISGGRLYGWAWDRIRPSDHLEVEIRVGDKVVATAFANQPRDDLKANGVGDGCHAFELAIELAPGQAPPPPARPLPAMSCRSASRPTWRRSRKASSAPRCCACRP